MQLNYGTSGFRYPVVVIHSIAFAIGQAVCLLSHQHKQPVGIMITASHNPHTDNGVKLVQHDGCMISPDDESFMVERVLNKSTITNIRNILRKGSKHDYTNIDDKDMHIILTLMNYI